MRYSAYWISPSGKIIPTETRHITSIIQNPKLFGLDTAYIQKQYKKHKEPVGLEGYAREEIMTELMKKGWIRVRYIDNGGWYFETFRLSQKLKGNILDFVSKGMHDGFINKHTQVSVGQVNGLSSSSPASDVISGEVEMEHTMKLKPILKEVMMQVGGRVVFNGKRGAGSAYGAGLSKGTELTINHIRYTDSGSVAWIEAITDGKTISRFSPNQLENVKRK